MLTMRWWAKVQLACGKIYSWWIKVTWPHPQPLSITPFRFIYHISVFSNLAILHSIQVGRFYGNSFARLFVCLLVAVVVSIAKTWSSSARTIWSIVVRESGNSWKNLRRASLKPSVPNTCWLCFIGFCAKYLSAAAMSCLFSTHLR